MSSVPRADEELLRLQSAHGVRHAAQRVFEYVAAGDSSHFTLDLERVAHVVDVVADVTLEHYPDLSTIPFHSRLGHFDAVSVPRLKDLEQRFTDQPPHAQRACLADLVITSVLLDAGAGAQWGYTESTTGKRIARSEGLAVASYWWFVAGGLSSEPHRDPLRADASVLAALTRQDLDAAFQVRADNPLVGGDGRVELLRRLGYCLSNNPVFDQARGESLAPKTNTVRRPSDVLALVPIVDGTARASDVLRAVLQGFGDVWPGRETYHEINLGDVWTHSRLGRIPFHKLSQWLAYSLCDVLQRTGVTVTDLNALTGLAEYRNGGLFLDLGVIVPRDVGLLRATHAVASDVVIEWRALTVALLDLTAHALQARWGMTAEQLPLVKVLEGGTWRAGRKLAAQRRPDAGPPLSIQSDGTVF